VHLLQMQIHIAYVMRVWFNRFANKGTRATFDADLPLEFLSGADRSACRTALPSNRLLTVCVDLVCFLFNAWFCDHCFLFLYSKVNEKCVSQAFMDQHNVRLTYFFVLVSRIKILIKVIFLMTSVKWLIAIGIYCTYR